MSVVVVISVVSQKPLPFARPLKQTRARACLNNDELNATKVRVRLAFYIVLSAYFQKSFISDQQSWWALRLKTIVRGYVDGVVLTEVVRQ